jgi:HAD superfamily hydrolase (TIGR01509 family)
MKLAIFDLDGVLVDTSSIHTSAFRQAVLEVIGEEASKLPLLDASDGVRTIDKLEVLRAKYQLKAADVRKIDLLKQEATMSLMSNLPSNEEAIRVMEHFSANPFYIAVASNSRRLYVDLILEKIGVKPYLDLVIAGDEVSKPKPDPEIFQKVMEKLSVNYDDTVIFEDSPSGIAAARASKATVVKVDPHTLITMKDVT